MKLNDWTTEELIQYGTVLVERIMKVRRHRRWCCFTRTNKDIHDCTEQYLIGLSNKVAKILKERDYK